jgi:hypothetical protein
VIHVIRGTEASPVLDDRRVRRISAYLVEGEFDVSPTALRANAGRAFIGSVLLGMGFTFDDDAAARGSASSIGLMNELIAANLKNAEVIFPYIDGEELNTDPRHRHRRYAINFANRSEQEARNGWPDLMKIVEDRVKPERLKLPDNTDGKKYKRF